MKDNRDYEDRVVGLEMKLDGAQQQLDLLGDSSNAEARDKLRLQFKEKRKQLVNRCEALIEANKGFKRDFDNVVDQTKFCDLLAKYPAPLGLDSTPHGYASG